MLFARDRQGGANVTYSQMRRNIQRSKNEGYPPAPITHDEIRVALANPELMKQFGSSGDRPFFAGCGENFTVFASSIILEKLSSFPERNYFIDATFAVVPFGDFSQLLVIHVEHQNQVS